MLTDRTPCRSRRFCAQGGVLLDDSQMLTLKQDVDYRSLKGQPSPEEYFLLSRIKGTASVAQICAISGLGKEKTIAALERLLDFGLLVAPGAAPRPTPRPAPSTASATPSDDDLFGAPPARPVPAAPVVKKDSHSSFVPVIERDDDELFEAGSAAFGGTLGLPKAEAARPQPTAAPAPAPAPQTPVLQPTRQPVATPVLSRPNPAGFEIEHNAYSSPSAPSEAEADAELFGGSTPSKPAPVVSLFDEEDAPAKANPASESFDDILALARFALDWASFEADPAYMALDVELDDDKKRELLFVYANIEHTTFYDLFGASTDADRRDFKKTYVLLSKRYHPDLYFRKNVGEFGPLAEAIFKWVTRAFQTLNHPQKRAEYDQSLRDQRNIDAVNAQHGASQNAEIDEHTRQQLYVALLQRGEQFELNAMFSEAVDEYRKALDLYRDPSLILRCAILLTRAGIRLDEAAMYARVLLGADPNHFEGLVVLGNIYERNGMLEDALEVYERAVVVSSGDPSVQIQVERVRAALGL